MAQALAVEDDVAIPRVRITGTSHRLLDGHHSVACAREHRPSEPSAAHVAGGLGQGDDYLHGVPRGREGVWLSADQEDVLRQLDTEVLVPEHVSDKAEPLLVVNCAHSQEIGLVMLTAAEVHTNAHSWVIDVVFGVQAS